MKCTCCWHLMHRSTHGRLDNSNWRPWSTASNSTCSVSSVFMRRLAVSRWNKLFHADAGTSNNWQLNTNKLSSYWNKQYFSLHCDAIERNDRDWRNRCYRKWTQIRKLWERLTQEGWRTFDKKNGMMILKYTSSKWHYENYGTVIQWAYRLNYLY